jgi:asparagine synthase (glutamine-hydrolysing)
MCGLVSVLQFDSNKFVDKDLLIRMTDTMSHRGPDGMGCWTNPTGNIGLGHRRLAIIDLSSTGDQPMTNETGTIWLTYNGEIYNFKELRQELESKGHFFRSQTDTEVILHAYEEWGIDCLHRFNGIWSFALWDEEQGRLFVARDRFGVKPLVYYHNAHYFACASELKALLVDPTVPREVDPIALHHYLSLMTIPAPFTIYKDIRKLRPGHYLLVEKGRVVERRWWTLQLGEENHDSEERILERLEDLLSDSVRLRLISDAPLGTFLSGGVDSSLISAIAARHLGKRGLRTFSVTFTGEAQYDESPYSRQVARHIDSEHTEIDIQADFLGILPNVVKHFDEPFAISSALAVYMMARETSRYVKVVLTGDGGDEVFAGYPWRHFLLDRRLDLINRLPFNGLRTFNHRIPKLPVMWRLPTWLQRLYQLGIMLTTPDSLLRTWNYQQELYTFNETEKFTLYTPGWAEHLRKSANFSSTDDFLVGFWPNSAPNRLARRLYFDLHTTLTDEMLAKVDKATMAFGIEARNPFLDYRLVEYALSLPAHLMAKGKNGKPLLKLVGKRFVPPGVLSRPKQGFNIPFAAWLRFELPPLLAEALAPERLHTSGIFQPQVANEIIARHQRNLNVNLSNQILTLAWFELWKGNG